MVLGGDARLASRSVPTTKTITLKKKRPPYRDLPGPLPGPLTGAYRDPLPGPLTGTSTGTTLPGQLPGLFYRDKRVPVNSFFTGTFYRDIPVTRYMTG